MMVVSRRLRTRMFPASRARLLLLIFVLGIIFLLLRAERTPLASIRQPTSARKAIVAASIRAENTSWISEFFPDWEHYIYVNDDPAAPLTVAHNKGNEASSYLTFITTHYANLPTLMIFLHGGRRYQWHNEDPMYDGVSVLRALQLEEVTARSYQNLRCNWSPGCGNSALRPYDVRISDIGEAFMEAYTKLNPNSPTPEALHDPCCSQFAVTRDAVHRRPLRHYKRMLEWVHSNRYTSYDTGVVMEHTWHWLFGNLVRSCEPAGDCFCNVYGLCNLTCTLNRCKRRWWNRPSPTAELPVNWPSEGQGIDGWPVEGWWNTNLRVETPRAK